MKAEVSGGGYEPRHRHKQELEYFIIFMMAGILQFLQGLSSQILLMRFVKKLWMKKINLSDGSQPKSELEAECYIFIR